MRSDEPFIVGLDHVQVAIPEGGEDEARAFYVGSLGFTEVEKPVVLKKNGGLWLECGAQQLHLGVARPFAAAAKAHPAFRVRALDQLRSRWSALGVNTTDGEVLPGTTRFYVSDPFGNRLEFLEPTLQESPR